MPPVSGRFPGRRGLTFWSCTRRALLAVAGVVFTRVGWCGCRGCAVALGRCAGAPVRLLVVGCEASRRGSLAARGAAEDLSQPAAALVRTGGDCPRPAGQPPRIWCAIVLLPGADVLSRPGRSAASDQLEPSAPM